MKNYHLLPFVVFLGLVVAIGIGIILFADEPVEAPVPDPNGFIDFNDYDYFDDWRHEPIDHIALFDFNETVTDPFTFSLDGEDRQFTHKEFRERLGFIEEATYPPIDMNDVNSDFLYIGSPNDIFIDSNVVTDLTVLIETDPLFVEPSCDISFWWDGNEIGRLEWPKGELEFSGDMAESAKVFFEYYLKPMVDEYIRSELKKENDNGN